MGMKFDLISDFHVEFNVMWQDTNYWQDGDPLNFAWHKARKNPVLVMAGDTSNMMERSLAIIEEAADYYDLVIWTDGNHEHYMGYKDHTLWSLTHNMERARVHALRDVENVVYLDGETWYNLDGTLFVGANGWYDFTMTDGYHPKQVQREWREKSNDPHCIRFGKKNRPEKLAERQAEQIAKRVAEAQEDDSVKEIVVVTHTIPHKDALIKDKGNKWYPLNGAYGNRHMIKVRNADRPARKIRTWVFGHTHYLFDFFDDGIRYVSNPRGYRGESRHKDFTPHGVVFSGLKEVDTEEPDNGSAFGEKDNA